MRSVESGSSFAWSWGETHWGDDVESEDLAPSQDTVVPADEGHYPEQTTDVQTAIRAARRDPRCDGRVYGVGGSAGASHALYVTATGTPGDDQFDLAVFLSGVYDLADVAWLTDPCVPGEGCPATIVENYLALPNGSALLHLPELTAASPITYVTPSIPPLFILTASEDTGGVGIHEFPDLLAKLDSIGVTESSAATPQSGHYKQWLVPVTRPEHAFATGTR